MLHSGTVCSALTAANYGRRGLAVSADLEADDSWQPASEYVASAVQWIMRAPEATVLNVNIPSLGRRPARGVRSASLADCGTVQGGVSELTGGFVPVTFADEGRRPDEGTDAAALAEGFVSVTAIRAVTDDSGVDVGVLLGGVGGPPPVGPDAGPSRRAPRR